MRSKENLLTSPLMRRPEPGHFNRKASVLKLLFKTGPLLSAPGHGRLDILLSFFTNDQFHGCTGYDFFNRRLSEAHVTDLPSPHLCRSTCSCHEVKGTRGPFSKLLQPAFTRK